MKGKYSVTRGREGETFYHGGFFRMEPARKRKWFSIDIVHWCVCVIKTMNSQVSYVKEKKNHKNVTLPWMKGEQGIQKNKTKTNKKEQPINTKLSEMSFERTHTTHRETLCTNSSNSYSILVCSFPQTPTPAEIHRRRARSVHTTKPALISLGLLRCELGQFRLGLWWLLFHTIISVTLQKPNSKWRWWPLDIHVFPDE